MKHKHTADNGTVVRGFGPLAPQVAIQLRPKLFLNKSVVGFELNDDIMVGLNVNRADVECVSIDFLHVWHLSPAWNPRVVESVHDCGLVHGFRVARAELFGNVGGDFNAFLVGRLNVGFAVTILREESRSLAKY